MSKNMPGTKEKILAKALAMFNDRGIEYVGLREIAASLGMRVSNITYYFPTKDDLVNHLSLELRKLNEKVVTADGGMTPESFVLMFERAFHNHVKFRCLPLSFVHLMDHNRKMRARYRKTQRDRNATLRADLNMLTSAGYLKIDDAGAYEFLVSAIALIARFWISEAAVSCRHMTPDAQIRHFASMIARMLLPYATPLGKKRLRVVLGDLQDAKAGTIRG